MIGSFKDINIIILSLLGSLVIALTSQADIYTTLFGDNDSYMSGLTSFFSDYFIIFLLGSILAKYIEASGAAQSIANAVLMITGREKPYAVLMAIFAIGGILTYGGISIFVVLFVVVPLARNIFRELNLPWRLIITPYFMGVATFTMTMMPGTPAIQNVIPSKALGTTLTAAPILGIASTIVIIIWTMWRIRLELNDAQNNGEVFDKRFYITDESTEANRLPNLFISILPLAVLVGTIVVGSILRIENIITLALSFSVILCTFLYRRFIPSQTIILNQGVLNGLSPAIFPSCAVGFGTVVSHSSGFNSILEFIQTLPISPLLSISFLTAALSGLIGTAAGALGIITESFLPLYNLSGYNPEVVHRLLSISSGVMPPQSGVLLAMYLLTGLNHKTTYKNIFIAINGGALLAYAVSYIFAFILY